MKLKNCKVCKLEKEENKFLFHSSSGYFSKTCIDCHNENRRQNRIKKLGDKYDHTKAKIPHKICDICKKLKKLDQNNFPKRAGSYAPTCRECSGIKRDLKQRRIIEKWEGQFKICTGCLENKKITQNFYFSNSTEKPYSRCIECEEKRGKENSILPNTILQRYRNIDKKKNLVCDLTLEFVINNINVPCTYCGYIAQGLDRKNNNLGHTEENCIPCCKDCNIARNNLFSHEEMFILGKSIKQIKDMRLS